MKLISFYQQDRMHSGAIIGDEIADLGEAPLESWISDLDLTERALSEATRIPRSKVELAQPIRRPGKILAIGANYAAHAKESVSLLDKKPGSAQVWFNKQTTAANAPYAPIAMPAASSHLDYEAEMVAVIGKKGRHVPASRALEIVAGVCVGNDVSVRDWQRASKTMTLGKSFDTHAPFGPWITTLDEVDNLYELEVRSYVNGELRQKAKTGDMTDRLAAQIAHLTTAFTLEPGDLLFTGTPAGVGAGFTPSKWLKVGDIVRCEIDQLGYIENEVIQESGETQIG